MGEMQKKKERNCSAGFEEKGGVLWGGKLIWAASWGDGGVGGGAKEKEKMMLKFHERKECKRNYGGRNIEWSYMGRWGCGV